MTYAKPIDGFRAVLFRMVPKPVEAQTSGSASFRAVLFRMVPKHIIMRLTNFGSFRAVLLIERAYKSACFFV